MTIECAVLRVLVTRSVMTKASVECFPHEVPLLMEQYEEEPQIVGPTGQVMDVDPDAEYGRLARKYGKDDHGQDWVSRIYGHIREGRLKAAMERGLDLLGLAPDSEDDDGGNDGEDDQNVASRSRGAAAKGNAK